jgi:TonB family protein
MNRRRFPFVPVSQTATCPGFQRRRAVGSVLLFMAVILTACATPAPVGPSIPTTTIPEDERYKERVREQIKKVWMYPCVQVAEDKCEHKNADLDVEFALLPSGELYSVKIVRSSGIDIYDSYAVNAIRLAAPYPPVPVIMIPPRKDEAEPAPTAGLRAVRPLPAIRMAARFKYVVQGSRIE